MAIYVDNGVWKNTEEKEELESFYADLVGPNAQWGFTTTNNEAPKLTNENVNQLAEAKQIQQNRIDVQTDAFKSLASTASGEDVLNDLLADRTQPNELRAAAAQATYPGMKASIGNKGELSFSAAPGSDLGFNYPDKARQTTTQSNLPVALQASSVLENVNKQILSLQNSGDYAEVSSTYQNLMASAGEFKAARQAQYENQFGAALGMDEIQKQMEADKVLDTQYYDKYYNGQYLGMSQQSEQTYNSFVKMRAERDKRVTDAMAKDPEIMMLDARVRSVEPLVNQRLGETAVPASTLVAEEDINKTISVLYGPEKKATAAERLRINKDLAEANPNNITTQALQIANMDSQTLALTAVTGSGQGAAMASRALEGRLDNPAIIQQLKTEMNSFDSKYLAGMDDEQKAEYTIPVTAMTPNAKALAKTEIDAKKFQFVYEKIQQERNTSFELAPSEWQDPQDPLIRDEVMAIKQNLGTIKNEDGTPKRYTIDTMITNMNWEETPPAKRDALVAYINSQADSVSDKALFGTPTMYANPVLARSVVDATIARVAANKFYNRGAQFVPR